MMRDQSVDQAARKHSYRFFFTIESVLLLITVLLFAGELMLLSARLVTSYFAIMCFCFAFSVLLMWHVVALPICFMYLIGKPIVMTLSPLIESAESRAFRKQLRERPTLSDEEFYNCYYQGTGMRRDVPVRLRRALLVIDPLIERVIPFDFLYLLDDELDFNDVIYVTEQEFGVRFTKIENESIDGTLDNLIRLVHMRINVP